MAGVTYTIDFAAAIARLTEGTERGANSVKSMARQMESASNFAKNALAALGVTLGVGFFVNFLKNTNDAVAGMVDLGREAGTTAEAISRFEAPARSAGLGLETVAAAIFKMSKAALEAKDPASNAAQALKAIGISTAQLKGLKPDEMFELVARSISKYSDGLAKNNIMQELFGKSGREMNKVVAEIAERGKLAATVTDEQAAASKLFNDQLLELKMTSEKFWRSLVAEGVPAMNQIIKSFIAAKEEGGLLKGAIAATADVFEVMFSDSLRVQLEKTNKVIANLREAVGTTWYKTPSRMRDEQQWLADALERKRQLEMEIALQQREVEARRAAGAGPEKPGITFDPTAQAAALKNALHITKQIQEGQEEWGKTLGEFDKLLLDHFNGIEALSLKYQNLAASQQAALIQQGEMIANSLDTESDIENRAYADKLARLEAYFATKEDFTAKDATALQRLTLQHEAALGDISAQGRLERMKLDQMTMGQQAEFYFGHLANITAGAAQHNRALFRLNQAAGIANAIISANIGATKALEWGWPMGPIFAAIIWAAAAVNIANIRRAQFGGGTSAPSIGGGSAIPVYPAPGAPPQQQNAQLGWQTVINVTVINNGNVVGPNGLTELVREYVLPEFEHSVNNLDLTPIGANSRQALMFRPA